jgi:hypothetical protein
MVLDYKYPSSPEYKKEGGKERASLILINTFETAPKNEKAGFHVIKKDTSNQSIQDPNR